MNKSIAYYTCAFFFAFTAVFSFMKDGAGVRFPASAEELTASEITRLERDKRAADLAMAQIDAIYLQAITKENSLAQGATVYDAAIQQSVVGRSQEVAMNPKGYMWPTKPYDNQYYHLMQSKYAIAGDRNHNLTYSNMQILAIMKQNERVLSPEQRRQIYAKYMQLNDLITASSSQSLYTWPIPNDPYLLAIQPGSSVLGTQLVAANPQVLRYDPLTGLYSNQVVPVSADFPIGGVQTTYSPSADVITPEFVPDTVAN